ncbi:hypothetical protein RIF29_03762 [Crotalaria pallida]|uniref:Kinesin motor domain-containing protein n=1 Tax=Crotalaria pallida TaxID=3830 RepID=A0AAN9PA03_CROPI
MSFRVHCLLCLLGFFSGSSCPLLSAQGYLCGGCMKEVVLSPGHALSFIAAGEEHRHVGSNNFNLFSNRSHSIFTLNPFIGKLSEGKASHVPYRDSKLTRLLQSSLSGHGHVSLRCTVTPTSSNMEETHNTLKFASRAKRVEIYASRNKIIDEKSLIKKYQREISVLRQELDQLKKGMLVGVSHEEIMSLKKKTNELMSLANKSAEQVLEIKSLNALIEKLEKANMELGIIVDMHGN